MTVGIVTDSFPPKTGGISTFNKHLVSMLTEFGHSVVIIYVDYENDSPDTIISEGLLTKVVLSKSYRDELINWVGYFKPGGFFAPSWIATGISIKNWLEKNKSIHNINVLEVSDYGGIAAFLIDTLELPVVVTGHGSLLQYSRYNYTKKDDSYKAIIELEKYSFLNATSVISHSTLNKVDLEELFERKIEIATIPWCFPIIEKEIFAKNRKMITIGGLQPIKGIYDALAAMEILINQNKVEIKLDWVGTDTYLAPDHKLMSEHLQKEYNLSWNNNFVWKGELPFDETQKLLKDSFIVLIPAFFETFNYIALEAAALKKPIIITKGTGASYLFTHLENALVIEQNNPKSLSQAIIQLYSNPDLCEKLGNKAHQLIYKEFAAEKIINERLKIYNETIKILRKKNIATLSGLLKKYRTPTRKLYFSLRKKLKKIIKGV